MTTYEIGVKSDYINISTLRIYPSIVNNLTEEQIVSFITEWLMTELPHEKFEVHVDKLVPNEESKLSVNTIKCSIKFVNTNYIVVSTRCDDTIFVRLRKRTETYALCRIF